MPHPEKKRRPQDHLCNGDETAADNNSDFLATIESLSGDVLANIFGFLLPVDIMNARLNRKMREAAKITTVPPDYELFVNSVGNCYAMSVMAIALPNLHKIRLGYFGSENKYVDGEDPDEEWAFETASHTAHDIGIISNFTKLRELKIKSSCLWYEQPLNGRYPCFFNFQHLQMLSIRYCKYLKFDLEMLAGLPVLKELDLDTDIKSGNINSLIALKDTLEKVTISNYLSSSEHIEGNFMDLADFQRLEELDLLHTDVTGGIQDIGEKDFPSLKVLALPNGGNDGVVREFQRISDAQDVARIPYLFQKQRPAITLIGWYAKLSVDSPDSYEVDRHVAYAPNYIRFVRAGTRCGYRWKNMCDHPCEVNWLDPEPDRESSDYGKYMEELQKIEGQINYFKGFHQPPTQEELERISERMYADESEMEDD